jgi:hypothetical protein
MSRGHLRGWDARVGLQPHPLYMPLKLKNYQNGMIAASWFSNNRRLLVAVMMLEVAVIVFAVWNRRYWSAIGPLVALVALIVTYRFNLIVEKGRKGLDADQHDNGVRGTH